MEVKKLKQSIADYEQFIEKDRTFSSRYIWESLQNFQNNWDIDAPDFANMYDRSFENNHSRRLWKREAWLPKEMMVKMATLDPEFLRRMFKDLADEDKEVEGRIMRFKFGCDSLLNDYKTKRRTTIENNHFHDDNQMVFLYLSFLFPEKYTLFYYPDFRRAYEYLASTNIPGPFDLSRFLKITNVFNTFLQKEETLIAAHQKRLGEGLADTVKSRLLVFDFYQNLSNGFRHDYS